MVVNPHLLTPTQHYGAPIGSASAVVVLVHGRGQSPQYMADNLVDRLHRTDLAFIAPAAADNTWYPTSFLAPLADNQPGLDQTMQRLAVLRDDLIGEGIAPSRIVWCGFSQGACAVSQFVSREPQRWGGLLALTGGLIGPPGTDWVIDGSFDGMPAYFSTSEADPFVPEDRVRDTAARFAAAGARVTVEIHLGREHEISDTEIDRARFALSSFSPLHLADH
jgi:phospholipase/carboxylesterase